MEYDYDPETGQRSQQRILGWDGAGWVESSRESYEYDQDGHLERVVHADGSFVEYAYDVLGNLVSAQDENHASPNTFHAYDARGRLEETRQTLSTAPSGEVATSYGYDAGGNLAAVVDANGNQTTYLTDDFGQLVAETSPVSGVTSADFDLSGNQVYRRDARGVEAFQQFDALGRILQVAYGSPGAQPEVAWEYDSPATPFGLGRLTRAVHEAGETLYSYDRRGLVIAEADGASSPPRARYEHDEDGSRAVVAYPSGMEVEYQHDFAGRPVAAASPSGPAFVTDADYLPFGPLARLEYGNGTVRDVAYDARCRLLTNRLTSTAGDLAWFAYEYDDAGNVVGIEDELSPAHDRAFGYDDLGRLVQANTGAALWGAGSYTYDSIGNLQQVSLGAAVLRTLSYQGSTPKLASVTDNGVGFPVTYDAAGNTTGYENATYGYSARGLLQGPVSGPGGPVESLAYDERGLRVLWGHETGPGSSEGRRYLYDRDYRLLATEAWSDPADGSVDSYEVVWFGGLPVASVRRSGPSGGPIGVETRWSLADHLGTVVLETDAGGAVTWWAEYEPYGEVFAMRVGAAGEQILRFPGQEVTEFATGPGVGSYNVHRWYQPGTGRYSQLDPIGTQVPALILGRLPGVAPRMTVVWLASTWDYHPYRYGKSSPAVFTDPLGLGVQRPGCDSVNECFETPGMEQCCECHDACYWWNDCSATSWGYTVIHILLPFLPDRPCDGCNRSALACVGGLFNAAPPADCDFPPVPPMYVFDTPAQWMTTWPLP
jgi:RHS repeat-associated protein